MHMHSTARTLLARSTILAMHSFYGIPVANYTTTTTTTTRVVWWIGKGGGWPITQQQQLWQRRRDPGGTWHNNNNNTTTTSWVGKGGRIPVANYTTTTL